MYKAKNVKKQRPNDDDLVVENVVLYVYNNV